MGDLEIKIHKAEDLKDVKKIGTMHAYVVAWVQKPGASYSADQNAEKAMTKPDKKGGCNPVWEEVLTLPVTADLAELEKSFIIFHLYTSSMILPDDTQVGSAVLPLGDLLRQVDSSGRPVCLTGTWQPTIAQVQRPSLRYQGTLAFSVRITIPGPLAASRAGADSSQRLPDSLLNNASNPSGAAFHTPAPHSGGPGATVAAMMLL